MMGVSAMDSIKLSVGAAPKLEARGPHTGISCAFVQIPHCKPGQRPGDLFSSYRAQKLRFGLKFPTDSWVLSAKLQVKRLEVGLPLRGIVCTSQSIGETAGSVSTSDNEKAIQHFKRVVMSAISNTNRGKDTTYPQRQAILKLIEELEELNPTRDPIDSPLFSGHWALLYTAPVDEKTADKYAGTEEGPFLARVKPAALGSVRQIRSTQVLDTLGGIAENTADFVVFGANGSLSINGTVTKAAPMAKGAVKVDVTFKDFLLKIGNWTSPTVSLGWINPKGWIETTYLDEDMRIGRGDKGSIFVAVRLKQT